MKPNPKKKAPVRRTVRRTAPPVKRAARLSPLTRVLRSEGELRKTPFFRKPAAVESVLDGNSASEEHSSSDDLKSHGAEGHITTLHTHLLLRPERRTRLTHAFSTRTGGVSPKPQRTLNLGSASHDLPENIEENRRRFFTALELAQFPTVSLRQVHGDDIHFVERLPGATLVGDGVFTDREGLVVGVSTADCVPILFAESAGKFVGALHAGWRGTAKAAAGKAVREACEHYGAKPRDITASIGPCIHDCCYRVGEDVFQAFHAGGLSTDDFREMSEKNWALDLVSANARQILAAGVPPENIEAVDRCTYCQDDLFFSFRREGEGVGHQMNVVAKTA